MLSGAPPNLCFTGHMPIDGAAVCAPAATHGLSCSFQKECMGDQHAQCIASAGQECAHTCMMAFHVEATTQSFQGRCALQS